jgi:type IV fimbrial biogenesis protein FimT
MKKLIIGNHGSYSNDILIKGFTLIELLISVSILFITTTMAIPAMTATLNNTRQVGQIAILMSHLQLTRKEAIYQNRNMLMCKSNDKRYCHKDTSWDQGWLIFHDKNKNKQRDDDEKIVFSHGKLNIKAKIIYNSFGGGKDYVWFYSRGYSHTNGTFTICNPTDISLTKTIILSRTGRVRLNENPKQSYQEKCASYI